MALNRVDRMGRQNSMNDGEGFNVWDYDEFLSFTEYKRRYLI